MKYFNLLLFVFVTLISFGQTQPDPTERLFEMRERDELAPFYHGVASGDPTSNSVIIWTRYTPNSQQTQPENIRYIIATDSTLQNIIVQDEVLANPLHDFTVKIDLQNLEPNTYYYYCFYSSDGRASLIGRTKTAPEGNYDHFRAAVLSCSSIYSGYFNGYARIAERNDLDAVIHLGDYIYDFVDGNGNNRVPDPFPEVPKSLKEWRARHYYYELDKDLIKARQQHPFIVIWDNHDVDDYSGDSLNYKAAVQAFHEWIPIRDKKLNGETIIYRQLKFGDLVELNMLDVYSYKDEVSGSAAFNLNDDIMDDVDRTYLGETQFQWISEKIEQSNAKWLLMGSQKMMTPWCLGCIPDLSGETDIPSFNDMGNIFNPKAWDGYQFERKLIFDLLDQYHPNNNLVLSGDAHLAFFADLTTNPFDLLSYNPLLANTGVEFLPSSLTRENLNEIAAAEGGGKPDPQYDAAGNIAALGSTLANPHHAYANFNDHGYGLIDITHEAITGEFWVSEKITEETKEEMVYALKCDEGTGKWNRIPILSPSPGKSEQAAPAPKLPPKNLTAIKESNLGYCNLLKQQKNELSISSDLPVSLTVYAVNGEVIWEGINATEIDLSNFSQNQLVFIQAKSKKCVELIKVKTP